MMYKGNVSGYCYECHRANVPVVTIGNVDSCGFVDQESGADLCADCLAAALQLIGDYIVIANVDTHACRVKNDKEL
jgi:hypothetical protein